MGGQVLGGGVIVLVAVLLWLVYLLPTWASRHRYDSVERNAVRLNQALRVLAETSETPREVTLELTARTAHAQQRLARRLQQEHREAELEVARAELAAARLSPAGRRARARRRGRALVVAAAVAASAVGVVGAWQVVTTGSQVLLWTAVAAAVGCGLLLHRMIRVDRRIAERAVPASVVAAVPAALAAPVAVSSAAMIDDRRWTPRELPRPLVSSNGSRAAEVLDEAAARDELRRAARDEALRAREAAAQPTPITAARGARADFAAMGHVDDAEIEAHVRELLARRAAG